MGTVQDFFLKRFKNKNVERFYLMEQVHMTSLGQVQPFIFFLSDYILRLNVLFINGETALITTNDFNFIVYKENIIYQS